MLLLNLLQTIVKAAIPFMVFVLLFIFWSWQYVFSSFQHRLGKATAKGLDRNAGQSKAAFLLPDGWGADEQQPDDLEARTDLGGAGTTDHVADPQGATATDTKRPDVVLSHEGTKSLQKSSSFMPYGDEPRLGFGLKLFITALAVTFYYYESEVEVFLEIFACTKVDDPSSDQRAVDAGLVLGSRWMPNTNVVCYTGSHGILTWVLGIPGLVGVAFFCPVVTAWFLARNKHRMNEPEFVAK